MWLLDARANAEKVTYPVIWEEKKDASNVIDYNINEEITTDKSSVFNANNDTTTGMATVIPWVNAPKLIQSTSIYQNWEWATWWGTFSKSLYLASAWENSDYITNWNISGVYWNINFHNRTDWWMWNWLIVPVSWWYQVDLTCPHWWSTFAVDVQLRINKWWYGNWITVIDHVWQYSSTTPTESVKYYFNSGDSLYAHVVLNYNWWSSLSWNFYTSLKLTKL